MTRKKMKKDPFETSLLPLKERSSATFFPPFSPQIGAKDKVICLFWDLKKASQSPSLEKKKLNP